MVTQENARVVDPKTFWTAIGVRAVGYAVVTASDSDGPAGFLALSATHLTANPPMLMVSIDSKTSALKTVLNSRHFVINYLPAGSESLVANFGGKGDVKGGARFKPDEWTVLTTGAPVLKESVGALDCVLEETIERYGCVIALGRLVDFTANTHLKPMVSFAGRTL